MEYSINIEVLLTRTSKVTPAEVQQAIIEEFSNDGFISPGMNRPGANFSSEIVQKNVVNVRIGDVDEILYNYKELEFKNVKNLPIKNVNCIFHVYHLEEEEIESENLNINDNGNSETISAANYCLLPHASIDGIWESLIFDSGIKERLLEYATTSVAFSQHLVDPNIICWNRVVLLYGPPGTGKTSLCKALAQKLAIRLKGNYEFAEFLEINSHSLFSKYFSESGKLVMALFKKIRDHLEYKKSFVCVLIDEIESLTHARNACMNGAEPSDSIRVVNAILTQLDQIRKYPNVLVLTTSNLKSAIDVAFVDRADLQIFIGPPSWQAIYQILVSCLEELKRVRIIESDIVFAPANCIVETEHLDSTNDASYKLSLIAKSCNGLSGRILRKFPFLAYTHYSKKKTTSLDSYIEALRSAVNDHKKNHDKIEEHHR